MNYDKYINKKVRDIPPSGIRKFFDIVNEMPDAISLGVGEPDFVTPWAVRDAAIKSIQKGYTQYTSNWGLLTLRKKISEYLNIRYGLTYRAENEIIVTVGASEAIDIALRTVIESGDEILIPEPSYVSYAPAVTISGGVAVPVVMNAADGFKLLPAALEAAITDKTKALILPYPNNPTGAIMEKNFLEAIAPVIIKHDLLVISDEIYSELTYDTTHVSIASLTGMRERTVVINGFSKSFAMTGWRLGYIAAPMELAAPMVKIHQYVIMCAPTFSQYGAVEALTGGISDGFATVAEMRDDYNIRRRYLYNAFCEMGLECFEPKGAFYIFPSVKGLNMTGGEFAERLLYSQKVAVVPGSAFGESGGYHVRCCYATSMKNLKNAVARMREFISGL